MADPVGTGAEEPGTGPSAREVAGRRPIGVTVLSVIYGISGLLILVSTLATVAVEGAAPVGLGAGAVYLAFALVGLAVAYGLFVGARWGWFGAVVLEVVAIASAVMTLATGNVVNGAAGLVIAALILWYLFKPTVQAWFGLAFASPWPGGRPA